MDRLASRAPDPCAARALYRQRARHYDAELAAFEPLRQRAVAWLGLRPGQTVLDVGCGTGLSLPALAAAVGPSGRVVGVEPCADMLAQARERVGRHGLEAVELLQAEAGQAPLPQGADALLLHFTHDVLQQPDAVDHLLAHLRPGAVVVACGLCWADWWMGPANWFVAGAALYSVTTLDGLARPWAALAERLPDLQVERTWMGAIYLARGTVPGTMTG